MANKIRCWRAYLWFWLNPRAIYLLLALILLLSATVGQYLLAQPLYALSPQAQAIINQPSKGPNNQISFNGHTYSINAAGRTASAPGAPHISVGQPEQGIFSASLPPDLSKGINVSNNASHVSFSLKPTFAAAAGRQVGGHFVYPLGSGNVQAVYTPQSGQLAEDLVINHPAGDVLSFSYQLSLPEGAQAFQTKDGGVAIEDSGHIVFTLAAPTIKDPDSQSRDADAKLFLKGSQLTLLATGLKHLVYPVSIDPTVVVNSTNSLLNGNNEGNVSLTGSQVGEGGLTGGSLGAWSSAGSTIPVTGVVSANVAYNGYVYALGQNNTTTSYYAHIGANGAIGSWTTVPSGDDPLEGLCEATAQAYNGYIYLLSGMDTTTCGSGFTHWVEYTKVNSDGSLNPWTYLNNYSTVTRAATSAVYNGYLYVLGGFTENCSSSCASNQQYTSYNTVQYARINSDGTIGSWASANSFTSSRQFAATVTYNGYMYEIGGSSQTCNAWNILNHLCTNWVITYYSDVQLASISSNGSLGSWSTTTALPNNVNGGTALVYQGYLYAINGDNSGTVTNQIAYAPIYASGAIGSWQSVPSADLYSTGRVRFGAAAYNNYLYIWGGMNTFAGSTIYYDDQSAAINPAGSTASYGTTLAINGTLGWAATVQYNGYIYELGGNNGTGATTGVQYAKINADGTVGSGTWQSATNLTLPTEQATAAAYNGFMYILGGSNGVTNTGNVYHATISGTGSLGSWSLDTNSLPASLNVAVSVAYNGYIYEIGGYNGSTVQSSVYYAPLNSNGTVGTWTASGSSLPVAVQRASAVVYGGYIYVLGGQDNTPSALTHVYYSLIGSNGTVGAWTDSTNALPQARYYASSAVSNGYIYEIGGFNSSGVGQSTVYYAPINSNGSVGSWLTNTALPQIREEAGSVAYNGYIYEIAGDSGGTAESTVYYAQINNGGPGTIGTWTTNSNALPQALDTATSVAYNGYIYEIGGSTGSSPQSTVYYAQINANGSIGTWTTNSNALPQTLYEATSVAYNGYIYEIGGSSGVGPQSTVYYAPINANGSIGTWTTNSNALPQTLNAATSVAYNGYIYEIGGNNGSANQSTVYYAPINANGSIGTWTVTTSLPQLLEEATSIAYNGYIYEIGGFNTTEQATEYLAPINANGSIGTWTGALNLPQNLSNATSVAYNGYAYELGGYTGTVQSTVYYAGLNSIPRVGKYSALVNVGNGLNVRPLSVDTFGSNTGNPGLGGNAGLGGVSATYSVATTGCTTLTSPATVNFGSNEIGPGYKLSLTTDGCSNTTALGTYVWIHYTIDDSQVASFPDVNDNKTNITGFTIFYDPASNLRIRGGSTFNGGSLQSLDAPPSASQ